MTVFAITPPLRSSDETIVWGTPTLERPLERDLLWGDLGYKPVTFERVVLGGEEFDLNDVLQRAKVATRIREEVIKGLKIGAATIGVSAGLKELGVLDPAFHLLLRLCTEWR